MKSHFLSKRDFEKELKDNVRDLYRKDFEKASPSEIYHAFSLIVKDAVIDRWMETQKTINRDDPKILYYMSMEFLMGRALGNNLLNIGAYSEAAKYLEDLGYDINAIEDQEPDPALGNGGLGRLAACFLDSLSTLGYPAYGCGIRYRYGMFRQKIVDGYQKEVPDDWLRDGYPFELKRSEYRYEVKFGGNVSSRMGNDGKLKFFQENCQTVYAVPYDMPIVGYQNNVVNSLMIWDAEPVEEFRLDDFDMGMYDKAVEEENLAKNLVEVLYPNDNHVYGKELRLKQQYFFVSASLQRAIDRFKRNHSDLRELPQKVVIQMNDTHPTLAVPELMRLLMDQNGLSWDDAWSITVHTCAYTNHTIMQEALEKWPVDIFSRLLPRIFMIVQEIDRRFCEKIRERFPGDEDKVRRMALIGDGNVRMANMAIAGSFSVNGVARLHTEILKKETLKDFYDMYPDHFSNKTNGITQRRFLLHGDPLLSEFVSDRIGKGWITNLSEMDRLLEFIDDHRTQDRFLEIKMKNKERLARYIEEHNHIKVDPESIFDVQVKRLHEYKRQLLNIIHVMYLYNQMKEHPEIEYTPRTYIFGAKASAGYHIAKLIIKLINNVALVINNDPSINGKLKVVFIEDYKVSNAELIFAAADVSEQISTASKEASGTSNMKFMLNGAITLGTMDGATVEMVEEMGAENAVIFGMSAEEVIAHERNKDYDPNQIYQNDPDIRKILDQLKSGFYSGGDPNMFSDIVDSLLTNKFTERPDTYFVLKDFRSYCEASNKIEELYKDRRGWAKMCLINIAHSGRFSSDRTIEEYVKDIWKLKKISVNY